MTFSKTALVFASNSLKIIFNVSVHTLFANFILYLVEFYITILHFGENFGNLLICKNAWVSISTSFDLEETVVKGVFEIAKFESIL